MLCILLEKRGTNKLTHSICLWITHTSLLAQFLQETHHILDTLVTHIS